MFEYLVVGAGFSGCILAERIATNLKKNVLVIDKRDHIAGNAYDFYDDHRILVHKYGPHIFHTNSKIVWDYLQSFAVWRKYEHKVLAEVEGKKVPIPFNLNSIDCLFPKEKAKYLKFLLIKEFGLNKKIPILKLCESKNLEVRKLSDFIFDKIFLGYTIKQWGLTPKEIDPSVTSRVPVFISRDNRYFQDTYQGIPREGYTEMFRKIISNTRIKVILNTDFKNILNSDIKFNKLIYTGPIDEYFDFIHGELPYRSLDFKFYSYKQKHFQETGQVNYPNNFQYTRISEFKYFTGQNSNSTTIAYEFPQPFIRKKNEPYYPIPASYNYEIYNKYKLEAEKIKQNVKFVGRLAEYKYYNMDQVIARALMVFEKEIL